MKITLEPTNDFVDADGVRCRVWEGQTEGGEKMWAAIYKIVPSDTTPDGLARFREEMSMAGRIASLIPPEQTQKHSIAYYEHKP